MGTKPILSLCLRKSTAIFLSFSLTLLNSLSYAQAPAGEAVSRFPLVDEAPSQTLPKDLTQLSLPAELGAIQEIHKGNSDKTVIYLEDAHTLYEAQKSIQGLIGYFQKTYGLNLVALEGGEGKLDPFLFRTFPDPKTLKQVFEDYLQKGELSGAAAASILGDQPAEYYGIEEKNLFEKGTLAFLRVQKIKPKLLRSLARAQTGLDKQKRKVYPARLLELDQKSKDFEEHRLDPASFLKTLQTYQIPTTGFPHLEALFKEIQDENQADQKEIQGEIEELAKKLRPLILEKSDLMKFNQKGQAYRTSQLSPKEFAHYLLEEAKPLGLETSRFKALQTITQNYPLLLQMQASVFFEELEFYLQKMKSSLLVSEEVRRLDQSDRRLFLLKRLAKLELTRKELEEFKEMQKEDLPEFQICSEFYEIAEVREKILFENLKGLTEKKKASQVLFLSGGFHTRGMTEAFKKNGISYVLISPRITQVPEESPYQRIMKGDVSWKNYFRVENGQVNLYNAFSRATVEQLTLNVGVQFIAPPYEHNAQGTINRAPSVLKTWRDEVIRRLAAEEKTSQARKYTRFIDETALRMIGKEERQSFENELRGRVDRFLEGLKGLVNQNKLTEENLFRLFKQPASMPAVNIASLIPGFEVRKEAIGLGELKLSGYVSSASQLDKRSRKGEILRSRTSIEFPSFQLPPTSFLGSSAGQANQANKNSSTNAIPNAILPETAKLGSRQRDKSEEAVTKPVMRLNSALDTASLRYGLKRSNIPDSVPSLGADVNKNNKIYDYNEYIKITAKAEVRLAGWAKHSSVLALLRARADVRATRKELYDFERWRMNEILTEAKAVQDKYGPRIPRDTEEKQALKSELIKLGEEMDDLLMTWLFPPEAFDQEANHFIEVVDQFYVKQKAISQNLLRKFFLLDLESLLKKFPDSYPETVSESEVTKSPKEFLLNRLTPYRNSIGDLSHPFEMAVEAIERSEWAVAREYLSSIVQKATRRPHNLPEESSYVMTLRDVLSSIERIIQARSEVRSEEQNKIQAMNQKLAILDQAAVQVIREVSQAEAKRGKEAPGISQAFQISRFLALLKREARISKPPVKLDDLIQTLIGIYSGADPFAQPNLENPVKQLLILIAQNISPPETKEEKKLITTPEPAANPLALDRRAFNWLFTQGVLKLSTGGFTELFGEAAKSVLQELRDQRFVNEQMPLLINAMKDHVSVDLSFTVPHLHLSGMGFIASILARQQGGYSKRYRVQTDPDQAREQIFMVFEDALFHSIEKELPVWARKNASLVARGISSAQKEGSEGPFPERANPEMADMLKKIRIRELVQGFLDKEFPLVTPWLQTISPASQFVSSLPDDLALKVAENLIRIEAPGQSAIKDPITKILSDELNLIHIQLHKIELIEGLVTAAAKAGKEYQLSAEEKSIYSHEQELLEKEKELEASLASFETIREYLHTARAEARVATKDFSKLRRDFQPLEDREPRQEFQKTFGNVDQLELPRYFASLGFSLFGGKGVEDFGRVNEFVYQFSSEWLWGAFGDIAGNFGRQRPSRPQGFQETFNRPVAQDALRFLIASSGTFHFLPVLRPKPGLVQVNHRLSLEEKGKAQNFFHFARRELFQDSSHRLGDLDGFSFHNKINSSTLLVPRQSIPLSRSEVRSEGELEGEDSLRSLKRKVEAKLDGLELGGGYYFILQEDGSFGIWEKREGEDDQVGRIMPLAFWFKEGVPAVETGYSIFQSALHQNRGIVSSFIEALSRELPADVIFVQTILNPPTLEKIARNLLEKKGQFPDEDWQQISRTLQDFTEMIGLDKKEYEDRPEFSEIVQDSPVNKLQIKLSNQLAGAYFRHPELKPSTEVLWQTKLGRLAAHYGKGDIHLGVNEAGFLELISSKPAEKEIPPEVVPRKSLRPAMVTLLGRLAGVILAYWGIASFFPALEALARIVAGTMLTVLAYRWYKNNFPSSIESQSREDQNQRDQSGRRSEVRIDNQRREKLIKIEAAYRALLRAIEKELPEQVQEIPGYGQFYPTHFIVIPEIVDFLGKKSAEKGGSLSLLDFGGGNAHTAFRLAAAGEKIKITSVEKNPFLAALAETVRLGVNENSLIKLSAAYEILKGKTETEKVKGKIESEIIPKLQTLNEVLRETGVLNRVEPVEGDGFKIDLKKFQAVYLNFPTLREAEGEAFQEAFTKKVTAELPPGAFVILFRHPFPAVDHLIQHLESRGFKRITKDFFAMDFPVLIFQKPADLSKIQSEAEKKFRREFRGAIPEVREFLGLTAADLRTLTSYETPSTRSSDVTKHVLKFRQRNPILFFSKEFKSSFRDIQQEFNRLLKQEGERAEMAHRVNAGLNIRMIKRRGIAVLLEYSAEGNDLKGLSQVKRENVLVLAEAIGKALARLHKEAQISHGDLARGLTPVLAPEHIFWKQDQKRDIEVHFIDFGPSSRSSIEDEKKSMGIALARYLNSFASEEEIQTAFDRGYDSVKPEARSEARASESEKPWYRETVKGTIPAEEVKKSLFGIRRALPAINDEIGELSHNPEIRIDESDVSDKMISQYVRAIRRFNHETLRRRMTPMRLEKEYLGLHRVVGGKKLIDKAGRYSGLRYADSAAQIFKTIFTSPFNEWVKKDPIAAAAHAFVTLVNLQPLDDGNKRTASFVMNYILMKLGYQPFILNLDNAALYTVIMNPIREENRILESEFREFLQTQISRSQPRSEVRAGESSEGRRSQRLSPEEKLEKIKEAISRLKRGEVADVKTLVRKTGLTRDQIYTIHRKDLEKAGVLLYEPIERMRQFVEGESQERFRLRLENVKKAIAWILANEPQKEITIPFLSKILHAQGLEEVDEDTLRKWLRGHREDAEMRAIKAQIQQTGRIQRIKMLVETTPVEKLSEIYVKKELGIRSAAWSNFKKRNQDKLEPFLKRIKEAEAFQKQTQPKPKTPKKTEVAATVEKQPEVTPSKEIPGSKKVKAGKKEQAAVKALIDQLERNRKAMNLTANRGSQYFLLYSERVAAGLEALEKKGVLSNEKQLLNLSSEEFKSATDIYKAQKQLKGQALDDEEKSRIQKVQTRLANLFASPGQQRSEARAVPFTEAFGNFERPEISVAYGKAYDFASNEMVDHASGLKESYRISTSEGRRIFIADDHHKVFPFWLEAYRDGLLSKGSTLLHIDGHPDDAASARALQGLIDLDTLAEKSPEEVEKKVRDSYGIDSFIVPAVVTGLIDPKKWFYLAEIDDHVFPEELAWKRNPWQGVSPDLASPFQFTYGLKRVPLEEVLKDKWVDLIDLDVDWFEGKYNRLTAAFRQAGHSETEAQELARRSILQDWVPRLMPLLARGKVVSIVTSPGFIDQEFAAQIVRTLLEALQGFDKSRPEFQTFQPELQPIDRLAEEKRKATETIQKIPREIWESIPAASFEEAESVAQEHFDQNPLPENRPEFQPLVNFAAKLNPRALVYWKLERLYLEGGNREVSQKAFQTLLGLFKNDSSLPPAEKLSLYEFVASFRYRIPALLDSLSGTSSRAGVRSNAEWFREILAQLNDSELGTLKEMPTILAVLMRAKPLATGLTDKTYPEEKAVLTHLRAITEAQAEKDFVIRPGEGVSQSYFLYSISRVNEELQKQETGEIFKRHGLESEYEEIKNLKQGPETWAKKVQELSVPAEDLDLFRLNVRKADLIRGIALGYYAPDVDFYVTQTLAENPKPAVAIKGSYRGLGWRGNPTNEAQSRKLLRSYERAITDALKIIQEELKGRAAARAATESGKATGGTMAGFSRHFRAESVISSYPNVFLSHSPGLSRYKPRAWEREPETRDIARDLRHAERLGKLRLATAFLRRQAVHLSDFKMLERIERLENSTTLIGLDAPTHLLYYDSRARRPVVYHVDPPRSAIYLSLRFLDSLEKELRGIEELAVYLDRGQRLLDTYDATKETHRPSFIYKQMKQTERGFEKEDRKILGLGFTDLSYRITRLRALDQEIQRKEILPEIKRLKSQILELEENLMVRRAEGTQLPTREDYWHLSGLYGRLAHLEENVGQDEAAARSYRAQVDAMHDLQRWDAGQLPVEKQEGIVFLLLSAGLHEDFLTELNSLLTGEGLPEKLKTEHKEVQTIEDRHRANVIFGKRKDLLAFYEYILRTQMEVVPRSEQTKIQRVMKRVRELFEEFEIQEIPSRRAEEILPPVDLTPIELRAVKENLDSADTQLQKLQPTAGEAVRTLRDRIPLIEDLLNTKKMADAFDQFRRLQRDVQKLGDQIPEAIRQALDRVSQVLAPLRSEVRGADFYYVWPESDQAEPIVTIAGSYEEKSLMIHWVKLEKENGDAMRFLSRMIQYFVHEARTRYPSSPYPLELRSVTNPHSLHFAKRFFVPDTIEISPNKTEEWKKIKDTSIDLYNQFGPLVIQDEGPHKGKTIQTVKKDNDYAVLDKPGGLDVKIRGGYSTVIRDKTTGRLLHHVQFTHSFKLRGTLLPETVRAEAREEEAYSVKRIANSRGEKTKGHPPFAISHLPFRRAEVRLAGWAKHSSVLAPLRARAEVHPNPTDSGTTQSSPDQARAELRAENEERDRVLEDIQKYMSEIQMMMTQQPWNFYDVTEQGKEIADQAKQFFEEMHQIIQHSFTVALTTDQPNLDQLYEIKKAAEFFAVFLSTLILWEYKKLEGGKKIHRLERGKGNQRFYSVKLFGKTYGILMLARWEGRQIPQARFAIQLTSPPGKDSKAEEESFRLDLSVDKGRLIAAFDLPGTIRTLIPDQPEKFHRNVKVLSQRQRFQAYVQAMSENLSRSEARQVPRMLAVQSHWDSARSEARSEVRTELGTIERILEGSKPVEELIRLELERIDRMQALPLFRSIAEDLNSLFEGTTEGALMQMIQEKTLGASHSEREKIDFSPVVNAVLFRWHFDRVGLATHAINQAEKLIRDEFPHLIPEAHKEFKFTPGPPQDGSYQASLKFPAQNNQKSNEKFLQVGMNYEPGKEFVAEIYLQKIQRPEVGKEFSSSERLGQVKSKRPEGFINGTEALLKALESNPKFQKVRNEFPRRDLGTGRSEARAEKPAASSFLKARSEKIEDLTPIYRAAGKIISSEEDLDRIVEKPLRKAAKIFFRKAITTTYTSANQNDLNRDRLGDGKFYAVIGFQPAAFSESNFKIYQTLSSRLSPWKYGEIKTAVQHGERFLLFPITEETMVQELNEKAVEAADQFEPQGKNGRPQGREAFYELLKLLHQNGWLIESGHYELALEWGPYHDLTAFDFLQGSVNRNAVFHWDEAMFREKKKFAQEIISHRMAAGILDALRKNHPEDESRLYALLDELGILVDTNQAKAWYRQFRSNRERKKIEQLRDALPKVQALAHERYRVHAIYFGYSAHDREVRNLILQVASQSIFGGTRLALELLPHELVYNLLSHGKGGAFGVKVLEETGNKILEIVAWDSGPGIPNPEKIRQASVEARGTKRGQGFRHLSQVPGEVIIESLGKRWEKTRKGNFQDRGASTVLEGDGTRITIRIPQRSEVRALGETQKIQPNYRDSFLRVMRELQETKKASSDQVRAIKNLVRWQEEAQETGRRIEGRYDAPLEIIVGHLEKPLYPDYENQITEFFINLPDKTVSRLVDRLIIVTNPGKAERSYQLFLDTARKALEEKPGFFDLMDWRLKRLDKTHYLGVRQLDSVVQERVRRAITDIHAMKESLPARAEVRAVYPNPVPLSKEVTPTSFLLRYPSQLQYVADNLLANLFSKQGEEKKLKVSFLAANTGEEVASFFYALIKTFENHPEWDLNRLELELIVNDRDSEILDEAIERLLGQSPLEYDNRQMKFFQAPLFPFTVETFQEIVRTMGKYQKLLRLSLIPLEGSVFTQKVRNEMAGSDIVFVNNFSMTQGKRFEKFLQFFGNQQKPPVIFSNKQAIIDGLKGYNAKPLDRLGPLASYVAIPNVPRAEAHPNPTDSGTPPSSRRSDARAEAGNLPEAGLGDDGIIGYIRQQSKETSALKRGNPQAAAPLQYSFYEIPKRRKAVGNFSVLFIPERKGYMAVPDRIEEIRRDFDPGKFHYGKVKPHEIIREIQVNGTEASFLTNNKPFAEGHFLLIPKRHSNLPQYLDEERYIAMILSLLEGSDRGNLKFLYNGPFGSVNQFHIHGFYYGGDQADPSRWWSGGKLPVEKSGREEIVKTGTVVISKVTGYPARALVFQSKDRKALAEKVFGYVSILNQDKIAHNILFTKEEVIVFPRRYEFASPFGPGTAGIEMAGEFIAYSPQAGVEITEAAIVDELKNKTLPEDEFNKTLIRLGLAAEPNTLSRAEVPPADRPETPPSSPVQARAEVRAGENASSRRPLQGEDFQTWVSRILAGKPQISLVDLGSGLEDESDDSLVRLPRIDWIRSVTQPLKHSLNVASFTAVDGEGLRRVEVSPEGSESETFFPRREPGSRNPDEMLSEWAVKISFDQPDEFQPSKEGALAPQFAGRTDLVFINSPALPTLKSMIEEADELLSPGGMIFLRFGTSDWLLYRSTLERGLEEHFNSLTQKGYEIFTLDPAKGELPAGQPGTPSAEKFPVHVAVKVISKNSRAEVRAENKTAQPSFSRPGGLTTYNSIPFDEGELNLSLIEGLVKNKAIGSLRPKTPILKTALLGFEPKTYPFVKGSLYPLSYRAAQGEDISKFVNSQEKIDLNKNSRAEVRAENKTAQPSFSLPGGLTTLRTQLRPTNTLSQEKVKIKTAEDVGVEPNPQKGDLRSQLSPPTETVSSSALASSLARQKDINRFNINQQKIDLNKTSRAEARAENLYPDDFIIRDLDQEDREHVGKLIRWLDEKKKEFLARQKINTSIPKMKFLVVGVGAGRILYDLKIEYGDVFDFSAINKTKITFPEEDFFKRIWDGRFKPGAKRYKAWPEASEEEVRKSVHDFLQGFNHEVAFKDITQDLEYSAQSFDGILVALNVLPYIEDKLDVVRRVKRLIKKDGTAFVSSLNHINFVPSEAGYPSFFFDLNDFEKKNQGVSEPQYNYSFDWPELGEKSSSLVIRNTVPEIDFPPVVLKSYRIVTEKKYRLEQFITDYEDPGFFKRAEVRSAAQEQWKIEGKKIESGRKISSGGEENKTAQPSFSRPGSVTTYSSKQPLSSPRDSNTNLSPITGAVNEDVRRTSAEVQPTKTALPGFEPGPALSRRGRSIQLSYRAARGEGIKKLINSQENIDLNKTSKMAEQTAEALIREREPSNELIQGLKRIVGDDGFALFEGELRKAADAIIPQVVLERVMGIRSAFADENLPNIPQGWQENFVKTRIPKTSVTDNRNFVIYTESVSPDSLVHFVKDTFPRLGKGSRLTVVYEKENDAQKIRIALKETAFWSQIQYHRVAKDLTSSLANAYQEFGKEGAVVVAPSVNDFSTLVASHHRLILGQELMEKGVPFLAEDVLNQIGVPLAGISAALKPEEIQHQIDQLMIQWSQQGFRGVQFRNGIIPNLKLYIEFITAQFHAESQVKSAA